MPDERKIIETLQSSFLLPGGIGDDAAVLPLSGTESYVISKDILVEDIHFRRRYFDPQSLACKALHVNLSDIAAMGARPAYVLLGLSVPATIEENYLGQFLHAFSNSCKTAHVTLIGGDTTASPDRIFISVTAIGKIRNDFLKFRNGAKAGDVICVVGNPGYAHAGFTALERGAAVPAAFINAFLRPEARTEEGIWLGTQKHVSAMMDISDGLLIDLRRLCEASGVAAELGVEQMPPAPEFMEACHALELDPLSAQLAGGEDYGLLFTVNGTAYDTIASDFRAAFGCPLPAIGKIAGSEKGKVTVTRNGQPVDITPRPFSHFGEL